ncbi:MAG: hypothetical protein PHY92_04275 [Alphaproteobacteria bacterium]|nr:hypothetical protein [Alphaproteobacteria bacterium]
MSNLLKAQSCCSKYGAGIRLAGYLLPSFCAAGYELLTGSGAAPAVMAVLCGLWAGVPGVFATAVSEAVGCRFLPKTKFGVTKSGKILRAMQIAAYITVAPAVFFFLNSQAGPFAEIKNKERKKIMVPAEPERMTPRQKELHWKVGHAHRRYERQLRI